MTVNDDPMNESRHGGLIMAGIVLIVIAVGALGYTMLPDHPKASPSPRPTATATPAPVCSWPADPCEDDPGWDCEAHGDAVCGLSWDCHTMGDKLCQPSRTVIDASWDSVRDIRDPYDRCRLMADAAELPPYICDPLKRPTPVPSRR